MKINQACILLFSLLISLNSLSIDKESIEKVETKVTKEEKNNWIKQYFFQDNLNESVCYKIRKKVFICNLAILWGITTKMVPIILAKKIYELTDQKYMSLAAYAASLLIIFEINENFIPKDEDFGFIYVLTFLNTSFSENFWK